jgi:hypothetical protein
MPITSATRVSDAAGFVIVRQITSIRSVSTPVDSQEYASPIDLIRMRRSEGLRFIVILSSLRTVLLFILSARDLNSPPIVQLGIHPMAQAQANEYKTWRRIHASRVRALNACRE